MGNVVETKVVIGVETKNATEGIDKVSDSVDNAADKFENLSMGAEGAKTVLDEATGGLASRVTNVVKGLGAMGKSAFRAFKTAVQGANAMKVALISTGIGAIVAAVGTLVAYWDDIVGYFGEGTEEAERQGEAVQEAVDKVNKLAEAFDRYNESVHSAEISAETNITTLERYAEWAQATYLAEETRIMALEKLKAAGIETDDININNAESLQELNWRIGQNIEVMERRAKAQAAQTYLEQEMAKLERLQEYEDTYIEKTREQYAELENMRGRFGYTDADIDQAKYDLMMENNTKQIQNYEALQKQKEKVTKATKEYNKQLNDLIVAEVIVNKNVVEQKKNAEAKAKADREAAQALKEKIAEEEIAAQLYEDLIRTSKEVELAEAAALQEAMSMALDAIYQEQLTAKDQELNAISDKYYQLEQYYIDDAETLKFLEEQKQKDIQEIQDRYRKEKDKKDKEQRDKDLADDKELEEAKQKLALDGIGALNAIAQAALEGNDKRARLAFRINKALSLSQAIMSTSQAVTAALAQTTDPSPTQSLRFANAALAGAQGLAQIIAITRQQFNPEGGAAGGGAASVPRPSVSRPALRFDAQGINSSIGLDQSPNLGNQIAESLTGNPIKAYVVSQEVQTQAKMNRKIRETATIG